MMVLRPPGMSAPGAQVVAKKLAAFSGLYPRRSYSLVVLCHCEANPLDPSADRGSVNRQDNGRGSAALLRARAGRRKSASHASQWRVSTAGSGASALRPFAGGLATSSATGDETHFCAGYCAAAVVEPVADDMPARNVAHPGPPIGCDAETIAGFAGAVRALLSDYSRTGQVQGCRGASPATP